MKYTISQMEVDEFETIQPLLLSTFNEIKAFALKKQDGTLSKLKVIAINQVLERAKKILDGEAFSEFLQILDIDTLPSNSDAVMIIANYKTALSGYRNKYATDDGYGDYDWNLKHNEDFED